MENAYLLEQYKLHPSMEGYDIIKFTFQAVFGAEHLLKDASFAKEYLHKEIETIRGSKDKDNEILFEQISDEFVRVNLYPFIFKECYSEDDLLDLFIKTASEKRGTSEEFDKEININLETLKNKVDYKRANIDIEEYMNMYKYQPVTHSSNYREKENPHYRVIKKEYLEEFLSKKEKEYGEKSFDKNRWR